MIFLSVLTGGATLVLAILAHDAWLRMLPRSVCPVCGEATLTVTTTGTAVLERWLLRRWCTACAWSGWGRNGPVFWPGRGPVSHGSGFRWGADRLAPDFGFRWSEVPPQRSARAHPSGFRWRWARSAESASRAPSVER